MAVELWRLSASELAALLARGDVSAVETVEAHISRIETVNPALNAVVFKRYDLARAEARAADSRRTGGDALGPLHGVPVSIKESIDVAGTPSTFGIRGRAAQLAASDDPHVSRLREAGAIVVGKTNVPQLLLYVESDNPLYGRTNNPWDLARTPGGSSGGEAAIIAAGGTPLGLGNDIGGSIRNPASFCGIVGIKPTTGRCSDRGRHSIPLGQRSIINQIGPLARTVDDVALGLQIINGGYNPLVVPARPLGNDRVVDVSQLRIAWFVDDGNFSPCPAAARAVRETAEILTETGAKLEPWQPPEIALALALFYGILSADRALGTRKTLRGEKRDPRIALLQMSAAVPAWTRQALAKVLEFAHQRHIAQALRAFARGDTHGYWQLVEMQMDYQDRFAAALHSANDKPFDAIICPAFAVPAFPHGLSRDLGVAGTYTILANVLGWPAGVVPITQVRADEETARPLTYDMAERAARKAELGSAGLPVGVQVISRPWQEHIALAVMRAVETVARQRPDFPGTPRDTTLQGLSKAAGSTG